jgi:ATP-dependent RNA helicase DDX51/DBP6
LATQVYQVFLHYAKGSDLKVGLAIGQANFQKEQEALIVGSGVDVRSSTTQLSAFKSRLYPGNLHLALEQALEEEDHGKEQKASLLGTRSISAVDVLVCTPGRLVDHMDNTPGFSLRHLRFLIIDEADRLLSQSYHGWIERVLDQAQQTSSKIDNFSIVNPQRSSQSLQLRKWLYSATLTKDPQKLAALQLVHPKQFSMQTDSTNSRSVYSMPPHLEEFTISCRAEQKPLVLLSLLMEFLQEPKQQKKYRTKQDMVVVFTSSLESTHRLTRLLQVLWPAIFAGSEDGISDKDRDEVPVAECSSSLSQRQKSQLVQDCNDPNSNRPRILVCSDGMSRGMDLEYVTLVINYDVPGFAKTYVHRCGRTARAEKSGKAISLLKGKGQMGTFRKLRSLIGDPERVQTYKCDTKLVTTEILQEYKNSLRRLGQVLASEGEGGLDPTHPLPFSSFPQLKLDKKV